MKMTTQAHLIFAMAAFGKPKHIARTWVAVLGGFLPDFSLYFLTIWARFVQGISFDRIFGELYYSEAWQLVFKIDNSFILWGMLLLVGLWRKWVFLWVLAAGALLHIGLDFPLHHDDGRAHFWPLSNWVFESPVSYWDPNHYGLFVAPFEIAVVFLAGIWVLRRWEDLGARIFAWSILIVEASMLVMFSSSLISQYL